ncbi:hypothetical protein C7C46_23830 [Streptomyces tateyamensis]|uniref:Bulb-type lectin domain-containing protein n=1 Tax=Streptomyces tateyamensis TaxID=565073 RepID=A0A2V4MXE2_9ACTN|nr:RHS repeat-associated core domain-containing protein [Streptomyces tateyamensis]PYC74555.1 hypothetical protein C7C46_23830 [Streptomyces tateyamensis]
MASHYDAAAKRLVADVTVPGGAHPAAMAVQAAAAPMTLGVVSGTSSGAGTYSASSLNPSTNWTGGGSAGSFTYNYPVSVPPTLGGGVPNVGLSYDSSTVDGKTSSTNSQASWIGDGWDLNTGYVERSFQPCARDGMASSVDDCWAGANLTMSLAGHSGELVPVDSSCSNSSGNTEQSACAWHLKNDDGSKIEFLTGASNGTWNGSYLRMTDPSGMVFYFGASHLPGADGKASSLGPDAQSAWTVPVFSPNSGDPCYSSSTGQQSWCQMAWRWNLDAVVDTHGNLTTYKYNAEANWYARGGNPATTGSYTRGGTPAEIDYGQLLSDQIAAGGTYQSAARVVFSAGERCVTSTAACDPSQRTVANAGNWPDVPLDQQCDQTTTNCANASPSFWTSRWLNSIASQVRSNGSYRTVDNYALTHVFVNVQNQTENTQVPWLASVQRTGQDNQNGQSAITLPAVSFGWMLYPNRVPALLTRPDYNRPRLTVVTTETGGTIGVVYQTTGSQRCTSSSLPAQANGDTKDCYNVKWYQPNQTRGTAPIDDWFQRYPVATVTVDPKLALGDKPQVTSYTYGLPAYHHNDSSVADPQSRTWDQFRGYASVTTVAGSPNDTSAQTQTKTSYYQGMGATVAGDRSGAVSDDDWLSGTTLETDTYNGVNGPLASYLVHTAAGPVTTADHPRSGLPDLVARFTSTTSTTVTKTLKADGSWQSAGTVVTTDSDLAHANRMLTSLSTADNTPDVCTRASYATSTNAQMVTLGAQSLVVSGPGACTATPTAANTVSGSRNLFDGQGYGNAGAVGDTTSRQALDHYDASGNPVYVTTAVTTYDKYGRAVTSTDPNATDSAHPNGATTTTAYASANAGELPNSTTVTTPAPAGAADAAGGRTTTTALDIARALPLTVTDANNNTVTKSYDALGRLTAAWPAGRSTSQHASQTFSYAVNGTSGSSSVTTNTLHYDDNGYSTSVAVMDGLGRTVQTQATPAFAGYNGRLVTDTFYDAAGHVSRTNATYYESTSAPSTTWFDADTTHVPSSTLKTFDGLGREITSEFRAYDVHQSSSTTSYPGADRTDVTPPSGGTPTSTVKDARGRSVQLWQYRTATATGNAGDADVTKYTFNPTDKPATRVDAAGNTWSYGYDLRGRQTTATDPDAGTATSVYDAAGRLASSTDARGQVLTFGYDLLGRKTAEYAGTAADPTKQLTGYTYDTVAGGKGQPASSTRYVGGTSGSAYTKAVGSYDAAYHATSVTQTLPGADVNQTTPYSYSEQSAYYPITGSVQWTNRGGLGDLPSEMLQYSYDSRGLMTSYGQQFGSQWMYDQATGYDAYGRAIRTTTNPWGTQIVLTDTFDEPTGRQVSQFVDKQTSQTGAVQQTKYAYNQAGQVTAVTSIPDNTPGSTDRQCFSYDYLGRLTTAWSDTGAVTMAPQPSVGAIGNCANSTPTSGAVAPAKTTVGGPAAYWQSYSYDLTGNRTQLVQHDAGGNTANDLTTTQTFPAAGTVNNGNGNGGPHALTATQNSGTGGWSAAGSDQYDAAGNTTKIVDPAGTRSLNGGWVLPSGQSITSNSSRLSMQADGNLVLVSLRTGAVTWSSHTYGHNGAYATMQTDGNFVVYDTNRNPLWAAGTYPNSGAYLALQDDGNLVVYKSASAPNQNPIWSTQTWNGIDAGNTSVLTWDAEGKLASTTRGGVTTTYVYDADGNLLERSNPTQNTIAIGATGDELTYNKTSKAVTGTRYYAMPDGLSLVATASTKTYQVGDPHGTNTLSLDASSLTETRNPVDPFGNQRTTTTATGGWAGDHGFVGGTKDTTSELTNLGAREYQPSTGRFISPDPLLANDDPQQWNGYAYANNKPTNTMDADGKMIHDDITGLGFGTAKQVEQYYTEHPAAIPEAIQSQQRAIDKQAADEAEANANSVKHHICDGCGDLLPQAVSSKVPSGGDDVVTSYTVTESRDSWTDYQISKEYRMAENAQDLSLTISTTDSDQKTHQFTKQFGASVTVKASGKADIPFVAEGSVDLTVGVTGSFGWTDTDQSTVTHGQSFTEKLTVKAGQHWGYSPTGIVTKYRTTYEHADGSTTTKDWGTFEITSWDPVTYSDNSPPPAIAP